MGDRYRLVANGRRWAPAFFPRLNGGEKIKTLKTNPWNIRRQRSYGDWPRCSYSRRDFGAKLSQALPGTAGE